MNKTLILAALTVAATLGGCATRANSVAPVAVSANDYSGLTCDAARAQLEVARQRQYALSRRQNNAALADAAAVLLVALPLGSVFGADVAGELAQAKGETLALERHIQGRCQGDERRAVVDERRPAAAESPYGPAVAPSGVAKRP